MDTKNSVAIVTGASSGIGEATARVFSQKGLRVALVARSRDKLERLSKELPNSFAILTDMTNKKEIVDMVEKTQNHFGRIDILINNAGQGYDSLVEKINPAAFQDIFTLDLVGPVIAMQQVIPIMRKQKKGTIVNIASGTALMYLPGMSAYSSMKRALVGVSLTAREELKEDGIVVSVVYPYITNTNFEKNTIKQNTNDDDKKINSNIPPGDTPEYVAQKIYEAVISGKPEIFAHDWMGKRK